MATQRQIEANRHNALKSTGPRTAAGKARSSQNARKHGFAARMIAIEPQDAEDFQELRDHWFAAYPSADAAQRETLHQIAVTLWKLGRLAELEAEVYRRLKLSPEPSHRKIARTLLNLDPAQLRPQRALFHQLLCAELQSTTPPLPDLPPAQFGRYESKLQVTLFRLFRRMARLLHEKERAAKFILRGRSQIAPGERETRENFADEADVRRAV